MNNVFHNANFIEKFSVIPFCVVLPTSKDNVEGNRFFIWLLVREFQPKIYTGKFELRFCQKLVVGKIIKFNRNFDKFLLDHFQEIWFEWKLFLQPTVAKDYELQ